MNWVRRLLSGSGGGGASKAPPDLVTLGPDECAGLMTERHGLPLVDWGMAELWIQRRSGVDAERVRLRRAVAGAWLDGVRDALKTDHKRWRHHGIEGLAPLDAAQRAAHAADLSIQVISESLSPIIGKHRPPVVALVVLDTLDDYYSFVESAYEDEGEFAASGGLYIRGWGWPTIAIPYRAATHALERTIAHEWTHHALASLEMPVWAEEGLTQMMEERVTGVPTFTVEHDTRERQRERWSESGLERFWTGESFHSPHEDEQACSYELSQILVRGLLATRPKSFFEFAREATRNDFGEAAARRCFGQGLDDFAGRILGE